MNHINNGPYQLLKKDPTTKIKTKTLKQLKVLKDSEFIDNKLYYYLKPTGVPVPRFYGQPEIHKPGVPIRPIVSYSGSPLYNLNKSIANILKAYVKDENNNAKNSTKFTNYIRNVPIEDGEIMVSFDVTFLYTNIPIIDALNIRIMLMIISLLGKRLNSRQVSFSGLLILSFSNKLMALPWRPSIFNHSRNLYAGS